MPEQDVSARLAERVGSIFAVEALRAAGGAAWWRPSLTDWERSIAVVTALTAQGAAGTGCAPPLRSAAGMQLGRQHSLDEDAFTALTLLAGYGPTNDIMLANALTAA